jgi:Ser/Thr protein kinase RdoA (MazF antagonist)
VETVHSDVPSAIHHMIPSSVLRATRTGFGLGRGSVRLLSTRFGKVCLAHRDHAGTRMQLRLVRETDDTVPRLQSEMLWLRHLHDMHRLAVPFPRAWVSGDLLSAPLASGDGSVWRAVACSWVNGRHLNAGLDARAMRVAGAFLARMHRANQDVPPGIVDARPTWWIPRLFELATMLRDLVQGTVAPSVDVPTALVADLRSAHDALVAAHARLPIGKDVMGLIHTDSHWQNLRFTQRRVGLVDFEDFATGRFMLDVACLWGKVEERRDARRLLDAIMDGYGSVSPLPEKVLHDLHVMLAFRRFDYAGWVLSWPRRDVHAWGPGLLAGLRAYVDHHLSF